MADREPRRRKKRRDSQKKEDVRSDDQIFSSSIKSELHDSDQEAEEDDAGHGHSHGPQATGLTKVLFVILFSGLIVSLGVIFISLQDADRGPADIFAASHEGHGEALHEDHLDHTLHDDHEASHDDHEALHDEHEDEVSLEDFIGSGINKLSSFFSKQDEDEDSEAPEKDDTEGSRDDSTVEYKTFTDQGILEEYEEPEQQTTPEPIVEETTHSYSPPLKSYEERPLYSEADDFTSPSPHYDDIDSPLERYVEDEPEYDVPTTPDVNNFEADDLSFYERADITNEADFEIRDQLDEVDRGLEKESDDDDDDDDDDDEEDDGPEDEFDFWQF